MINTIIQTISFVKGFSKKIFGCIEYREQLPGPLVFIVGFASEKHDSFERLPGHRHGADDTALQYGAPPS